MLDTTWYYCPETSRRFGPALLQRSFTGLRPQGRLLPTDMVLQAGTQQWVPAKFGSRAVPGDRHDLRRPLPFLAVP